MAQSMQNMHLPRSTDHPSSDNDMALVGQFSAQDPHPVHRSEDMGMVPLPSRMSSAGTVFLPLPTRLERLVANIISPQRSFPA